MAHKHDHACATCKHDCLHFCPCCDKVYCCKCDKEWGNSYNWYRPYWDYKIDYYPPTIWTTNTYDINSPNTVVTCNHLH